MEARGGAGQRAAWVVGLEDRDAWRGGDAARAIMRARVASTCATCRTMGAGAGRSPASTDRMWAAVVESTLFT
ncbi:MAG: hypothetical protein ACO3EK_20790 [Alphaproteobacteria bacterium]